MSLRQQQSEFLYNLAEFILWVRDHDSYDFTAGDAYRDPKVFGPVGEHMGYGNPRSKHKSRLAMDLNLFVDGKYIGGQHDAWAELGEKWKEKGGSWGGDFTFKDFNHFSVGEKR